MQLKDLVKAVGDMTDEELHEKLREIRHRRTVERPAAKARERREDESETRKVSTKAKGSIDKMLAGMTPEAKRKLMEQLQGGSGDA